MPSFKQSQRAGRVTVSLVAGALALMPALVLAQQAPDKPPPKAKAQPQPKQPAQAPAQSKQPGQAPAQAQQPAQPAQQQGQQPQQQQQPPSQAPPPSVVQVKSEPSQTDWTKACGKDPSNTKDICYTTRDFVSDQNVPVISVAVYDVKGDPLKITRFLLPLQLLLQPGLRVFFDQGQPMDGKFAICFPNGCFAEVSMKEADFNTMKKAANLNVQVQNQMGNIVTFQVPLAGFGKAIDGPAVDPQELQKKAQEQQQQQQQKQKDLQDALTKQGKEELEKRGGASAPKQ